MNSNKEIYILEIKKELAENYFIISVSHICKRFGVYQSIALEICNELVEEGVVQKCFKVICPNCNVSTGKGGFYNQFKELSFTCDCGYKIISNDENIRIYYQNKDIRLKKKKKDEVQNSEKTLNLKNFNFLNKSFDKEFLSKITDSAIWHISDLHIGPKELLLVPNHSQQRLDKFISLLRHRTNVSNDIVIISGDLTTNGSSEAFKMSMRFIKRLIKLGIPKDRILIVPGNHDAWKGKRRLSFVWRSFYRYLYAPKVKTWKGILQPYNFSKIITKKLMINNLEIDFKLIDSTINNELSLGYFPDGNYCKVGKVKFLIMHHHLIDLCKTPAGVKMLKDKEDLGKISKLVFEFKMYFEGRWMKVVNYKKLRKWICESNVNVLLHGHQHYQFFSEDSEPFKIICAPTLSEDGSKSFTGYYGFNFIVPKEKCFDLYQLVENGFNYKINQFFPKEKY